MSEENKVNELFRFIFELFNDLEENEFKINHWDLKCDGDIFYFNGHNGTKHDWFVNGHIPSLATLYDDYTECVKIHVYSDGIVKAYYYQKGSMQPDNTLRTEMDPEAVRDLAVLLYSVSDAKGKYDKRINDLDQFYEVTEKDFEEFEKQE